MTQIKSSRRCQARERPRGAKQLLTDTSVIPPFQALRTTYPWTYPEPVGAKTNSPADSFQARKIFSRSSINGLESYQNKWVTSL